MNSSFPEEKPRTLDLIVLWSLNGIFESELIKLRHVLL